MSSDILSQPDLTKKQKKLKKKIRKRKEREWDAYLEHLVLCKSEDSNELEKIDTDEHDDADDADEFIPDDDAASDESEDDAANLMKLLGKGAMLLLGQSKIDNEVWKKGLTNEEIKRYSWIFDNMNELELDIPKVLRSNLSDLEKEKAIYVILNYRSNTQPYEDMAKLIQQRNRCPLDERQLNHFDELEKKMNHFVADRTTLKHKVLSLPLSDKYLAVVWETYEYLQQSDSSQGEYHKRYGWLTWILQLPWYHTCPMPVFRDSSELRIMITTLRQQLDMHVYGLNNVKEELLLFCMDYLLPKINNTHYASGKILAIEGSPGVGKTHIIRTLAKYWGLPFQGISAGGNKDSSFWDGHLITYEGSVPGCIVKALRQAKVMNPVICIDEIDKISEHEEGKDVTGELLHVLDETQNSEFHDKYIGEIPIDLSKVFWVLLMNDRHNINAILRDRLYIIKVPDPKPQEKVETALNIMIPQMLKHHELSAEDVTFTQETILNLIQQKTSQEKGMRCLKKILEAIIRRISYLKNTMINISPAAIWHAANILKDKFMQPQPQRQSEKDSKQQFAKRISFYFPEFSLPLIVTPNIADKLLTNYQPDEHFDYVEKGWII